ncbi:MAG: hypothetical protein K0S14_1817 [Thermomicrobiales bacterium]|nr:hypothetical protein [Thermomicrobiales bacterium]
MRRIATEETAGAGSQAGSQLISRGEASGATFMGGAQMHFSGNDDGRPWAEPSGGRSRTVTFRVSNAEFDDLVRGCRSSGARSLSAFTRDAALDKIRVAQTSPLTLTGDLTTLTKALAQVDCALQDAIKMIRRVLGSASGAAAPSSDSVQE